MMSASLDLLEELSALVSTAALAILKTQGSLDAPQLKADHSPVTAADFAAQSIILDGLARLLPGVPVVSEEAPPAEAAALGPYFVLVDPLDGTKEFLAGRDEFTINVAVIADGVPVLGVLHAPARQVLWRGIVGRLAERLPLPPGADPRQAPRTPIRTRPRPARLCALTSRSHLDRNTEAFLAAMPVAERIACGSALKFGLVAEGTADVYPRLAPTSQWDIAAGHAVVTAAGGIVLAPDGAPLSYGRGQQGFQVRAFIAWGDPAAPAMDR
jgi:3'(2'), 5'-bisphosphate nucleotidase